ncbi:MAG: glycine--tRNA ligase subunit beta [Alphaproteobacteria bacterium]|nr:glycine--tRNA ligase subunit beta [Alphaproteobacteria bacterium]
MPDLLLELLTEEIPARMQARAAEDLCRLVGEALKPIAHGTPQGFHGPRRIGLVMQVAARADTAAKEERGPRVNAPEAALAGFLKKHGVEREALTQQGDFWVLVKPGSSMEAASLITGALPDILWNFPWPKSMRWGQSGFLWVRPLQRILCLLDGAVVPFSLARGDDAAHGLASGNVTEGHRVHGPGEIIVTDHVAQLRARHVIVDAAERAALIRDGITQLAAAEGLEIVPDEGLLAEVAGLVEWPVPLLGRIDDAFMDLPAEVMRTSMRVNQRYFALRQPDGPAAARFAVVANIAATDGGAALVAGNERVLRARLSDARFFWDQDRRAGLESFLPKLDGVVFHAKLGTQGQRVARLERLARMLAPMLGADPNTAARAAKLCKADLASGMVGEFPELQGVMGGYYAAGEGAVIAGAIAQHYRPMGPGDAVPSEAVAATVALADKIDQLVGFFDVDEKPTGSGDPFALRRAALGVIRILREGALRLPLRDVLPHHLTYVRMTRATLSAEAMAPAEEIVAELLAFLFDRLRVQLRAEGARADIITAAIGDDDDILRVLARAEALRALVETDAGAALLAACKRAQNILRAEAKKGFAAGAPEASAFATEQEAALHAAILAARDAAAAQLAAEDFSAAMTSLAALRGPLDAFFDGVLVNDPTHRDNRLRLLSALVDAMHQVADLSKIEA